jgi:hypothetical protein
MCRGLGFIFILMPKRDRELLREELHLERICSRSWVLVADLKTELGSRAYEIGQRLKLKEMDIHALVVTPFQEEMVRGQGKLDPWEALWRLAPYCTSLEHLSCSDISLAENASIREAFELVEQRLRAQRAELIRRIRSTSPPAGWSIGRIDADRTLRPQVTTLVIEDWVRLRKLQDHRTEEFVIRVGARHRRRWPDSFFQELELSRFPNLTKIEWHTKCGGLRFDNGVLRPLERLSCLGLALHVIGDSTDLPEVNVKQLNLLRAVATTVEWRP